ncbi:MAG: hypothetical protein JO368_08280 [Acidimicrobiales bacterium]|nr:hypothetical protein [Acidimicrobiales bacterium]
MTHRRTWQRAEARAAALFGAARSVLSGSAGRGDRTASDSTHPRLFLEVKLQATSAVRTLWEATRTKALKEGKVPVVVLCAKNKPGVLVVVSGDDLATVAGELPEGATPDGGGEDEG